jgi:hypothetical protein
MPPIQPAGMRLPPPRVPVFTRIERPLPIVQPPPPLPPPVEPPLVQPEAPVISTRYLEVRIVVPVDDAGNVREEVVMKLPAEWLERLPAIMKRLPDDRYRIYLMLSGGEDERLVIDVFVRDGRPVEPTETQSDAAPTAGNAVPMPDTHRGDGPAAGHEQPSQAPLLQQPRLPELPAFPPEGLGQWNQPDPSPADRPAAGRVFIGAAAAAAALVAGRSAGRRQLQVDQAAEQIGRHPRPRSWRWWRTIRPDRKQPY